MKLKTVLLQSVGLFVSACLSGCGEISMSVAPAGLADFTSKAPDQISFASSPSAGVFLKGGTTFTLQFRTTQANKIVSSKLLYSYDGVTFSPVASNIITANNTSYIWAVPTDNSSAVQLKIQATLNDNSTLSASSNVFGIDSQGPTVNITSPLSLVKGGQALSVNFTATDNLVGMSGTLSSLKFSYSVDGGMTYSTPVAIAPLSATNYNWTPPTLDSTNAKIKITATDALGNSSFTESSIFTIDSTPPAKPTISIASATLTKNTTVDVRIDSCGTDTDKIYISESSAVPAMTAVGWTSCSSSTIRSFTVTGEGVHTFYAFSKDSAGNVQNASASAAMTLDLTSPLLSGLAIKDTTNTVVTTVSPSMSWNIVWSATDLQLATNPISIDLSTDGGNTWSSLASSVANSGSYSWTPPNINTNQARLKITAIDAVGNAPSTLISASNFTITNSATNAPHIALNTAAISKNVSVDIKILDCDTNVSKIYISENSTIPTTASSWFACSANQIRNFTVSGEGVHTFYAWSQDALGNIQSSPSTVSMTLDQTSPVVSGLEIKDVSNNTVTAVGPAQVWNIIWNATDAHMAISPITIELSTDSGNTWSIIATNLANSGTYAWTPPNITTTQARLRISAIDLAGNTPGVVTSASDFGISNTPPNAPHIVLNSANISKSTTADVKITDCNTNINKVFVSVSATTPTGASAWVNCSANLIQSLTVSGEGVHTIYAWSQDILGNIQNTPSTVSMTLDQTSPIVSGLAIKDALNNTVTTVGPAQAWNIVWSAADANMAANPITIELSTNGGTSWSTIVAGTSNSGSYSWTPPNISTTQARIRVSAADIPGNPLGVATTGNFTINNVAPNSPHIVLNSLALSNSSTVDVKFTDCNTGVAKVYVSENSTTPTSASAWVDCSVNLIKSVTVTGDGTHTINAWSQDSAGNIQATPAMVSMVLDQTPPTLSLVTFSPTSNPRTAHPGIISTIAWKASDLHFGAAPIKIEVSLNSGATWSTVVAAISNSGSYNWIPDPSVVCAGTCKLKITATDQVNQSTSVQSVLFTSDTTLALNINTMSVYSAKHPGFAIGDLTADHPSISDFLQILMPTTAVPAGYFIPDLGGGSTFGRYGPRLFDWGGGRTLRSSYSTSYGTLDFANPATFNTVDPSDMTAKVWTGEGNPRITDAGVPDRIVRTPTALKVAYVANDPIVAGKCRNEINTYHFESKKRLVWDFSVQIGDEATGTWPLDGNPTLIIEWFATLGASQPSYSFTIADDLGHPGKISLSAAHRESNSTSVQKVMDIPNLNRYEPIDILVDYNADYEANGYFKVYINGTKYALTSALYPNHEANKITLNPDATQPHRMAFGIYMYNQAAPATYTRETYWYRARALVP